MDRLGRSSVNFVLLDVEESVAEEVGLFFVKAIASEVILFFKINSLPEPLLLQVIVLQLKCVQFLSFFIGLLDKLKQVFDFFGLKFFVVADFFLLNFLSLSTNL